MKNNKVKISKSYKYSIAHHQQHYHQHQTQHCLHQFIHVIQDNSKRMVQFSSIYGNIITHLMIGFERSTGYWIA